MAGLVVGRDDLVRKILDSSARLTVLVGDSGVGKSTSLAAVQRLSGSVGPEYVRLKDRSHSALRDALISYVEQATSQCHSDNPIDLASATARTGLRALGKALREHVSNNAFSILVDMAKARYGEQAAAVLPIIRDSLAASKSDRFASRVAALRTADVFTAIGQLCTELVSISERSLTICIDDLHLATAEELSQLEALADALPQECRIVCTYTASGSAEESPVRDLMSPEVNVWPVSGLLPPDIAYLLERRSLPATLAPTVHTATDGYAIHVQAAIDLLVDNPDPGSLRNLSRQDVIRRSTKKALSKLDPGLAIQVRILSSQLYRPSDSNVCRLLGIDAITWDQWRDTLVAFGLFITKPDGPWFHELRRLAVWDDMSEGARRQAAVAAVRHVLESTDIRTGDVLTLSANLDVSRSAFTHEADLSVILNLSRPQLAVATAILELSELAASDPENRFVDVDGAFLHARHMTPEATAEELIAAVQFLESNGLIIYTSNDRAAVASPYWTARQGVLCAARAHAVFGRLPHPGIASFIFDALRVEIGQFRYSSHSLSGESVTSMSKTAQTLGTIQPDGSRHIGRRDRPALIIKARLGDLPWSGTVTYDSKDSASSAAQALQGLSRVVGDDLLVVDRVLQHPLPQIPSRRFVNALEMAMDTTLDHSYSQGKLNRVDPDANMSFGQQVEERVALREIIRARSSVSERDAYGIAEDEGIFFRLTTVPSDDATLAAEATSLIVRVRGAEGAHEIEELDAEGSFRERFQFLKLSLLLKLGPHEHITSISSHWGIRQDHHLVDELEHLTTRAHEYNKAQDPSLLTTNLEELQGMLTSALSLAFEDAQALRSAVPSLSSGPLGARQLFVSIRDRDESQWSWGGPRVGIHTFERAGNLPSVHVTKLTGDDASAPTDWNMRSAPDWIVRHPSYEGGALVSLSHGGLGQIAELLGYYEDELDTRMWNPDFVAMMRGMEESSSSPGPGDDDS